MIGWFLLIIGNIIFWTIVKYATKNKIDLKFTNPNKYTFLESLAQLGFWLAFLGLTILIWG